MNLIGWKGGKAMSDAILSVSFAGPLVTIQDGGRPGNMRFGVSASGPMDRLSFDAANAALGNEPNQTGVEVSMGGVILQCKTGAVSMAIAGGDFVVDHAGAALTSWQIITLSKGERLSIRAGKSGSWTYIAVAGALRANSWLNSAATHSTSGYGGGAVRSGQVLVVENAAMRDDREGDIPRPDFIADGPVSAVIGPQDRYFAKGALDRFGNEAFTVTDAYDRMGMRLSGPEIRASGALSIPSEPIVRGSVQVSGDGVPTILLADHQTTGGYPKIATVASYELDRLTQLRSGASIRFKTIPPEEALSQSRKYHKAKSAYLAQIAIPRGTLEQRLLRENLIHGFLPDEGF